MIAAGRIRSLALRFAAFALAACFHSRAAAPDSTPYPESLSKKGLQVQMTDDALALGVRHAALNVDLSQIIDPRAEAANLKPPPGPPAFHFRQSALEGLDRQIQPLSDRGVVVSLILLNRISADPDVRRILTHPGYETNSPNGISAFNTRTAEGRAWLSAVLDCIAQRWSGADRSHGRVWNWILGNEINSHGAWCNEGSATLEAFTEDYLAALRLAHQSLRSASDHARIFVSLEHHWNIRYAGADAGHGFPARPFLERLARRSAETGDFDWHVAFHPYPENLFNPRTWLDTSATRDIQSTPRITFKNIDLLPQFLRQEAMLCHGRPRRVILSEQGFHTSDGPDGETLQAAAFCYAWKKVERLDGVDAFILHRHVDHGAEGGLRLGLWTRDTRSANPAQPLARKRIYEVFQSAGGPGEDTAFAFALPILGLRSWAEINP